MAAREGELLAEKENGCWSEIVDAVEGKWRLERDSGCWRGESSS